MGQGVMRRPPQYCNGFIDRYGKARWYFRRAGFKRMALPGLPWSPEFMAAYEQALAGQPAPIGTERISSNALLNLLEVGPDPVTPAEGGKTLTFSAVSSLFLAAGALN